MVRYIVFLAAAVAAYAQGSPPKPSVDDYPVQAKSGATRIGADFMVHSFSTGEEMFIAEKYLVVEVAFYPPKGGSVAVAASDFTLSVNGKKPLAAQNPAMVASSLKHRDWQFPHGPLGNLGIGGGNVGGGQPRTQGPFPGGPEPNRLPTPPRAPDGDSNTPTRETPKAEEVLVKTALPEGKFTEPVSGFIFFPWTGKVSAIKSLELLYDGVAIKLR
jgi:hypothetical protein